MGILIFLGVMFGIKGSGIFELGAASSMDCYFPKDNSTYVGSRAWESRKGDWSL